MKKNILKFLPLVAMALVAFTFVACGGSNDEEDIPKKETLKTLEAGFKAAVSSELLKYFDVEVQLVNKTTGEKKTEILKEATAETSRFSTNKLPQTFGLTYKFSKKGDAPEKFSSSRTIQVYCRGIYSYWGTNGSFSINHIVSDPNGTKLTLEGVVDAPVDELLETLNAVGEFTYTIEEGEVTF